LLTTNLQAGHICSQAGGTAGAVDVTADVLADEHEVSQPQIDRHSGQEMLAYVIEATDAPPCSALTC
jgi:hypothetical protein